MRSPRARVARAPSRSQLGCHGGPAQELQALPPGIAFSSLPSTLRVRFGTTGTADNATVVLASGPRTRRVVVNQRGRVHIQ